MKQLASKQRRDETQKPCTLTKQRKKRVFADQSSGFQSESELQSSSLSRFLRFLVFDVWPVASLASAAMPSLRSQRDSISRASPVTVTALGVIECAAQMLFSCDSEQLHTNASVFNFNAS